MNSLEDILAMLATSQRNAEIAASEFLAEGKLDLSSKFTSRSEGISFAVGIIRGRMEIDAAYAKTQEVAP